MRKAVPRHLAQNFPSTRQLYAAAKLATDMLPNGAQIDRHGKDLDDYAQELSLHVWQLRRAKSVGLGYLVQASYRRAKQLRRANKPPLCTSLDDNHDYLVCPLPGPHMRVEAAASLAALESGLSVSAKEVLHAACDGDLSRAEQAHELGISRATFCDRLRKARVAAADLLEVPHV